jgi:hypothetical protein
VLQGHEGRANSDSEHCVRQQLGILPAPRTRKDEFESLLVFGAEGGERIEQLLVIPSVDEGDFL